MDKFFKRVENGSSKPKPTASAASITADKDMKDESSTHSKPKFTPWIEK